MCIELDERRYAALSQKKRFESLDLKQVIRQQQLTTLLLNLILVAYQQQLGGKLGVLPGSEFLEAATCCQRRWAFPWSCATATCASRCGAPGGRISLWRRFVLFGSVLHSAFNRPTLTEDDLRKLRESGRRQRG